VTIPSTKALFQEHIKYQFDLWENCAYEYCV